MIDLLTDPIGALLGILALVAAFFGWGKINKSQGRKEGRDEAVRKGLQDAQERVEEGSRRVAGNRGDDPADRLRRNDGIW